MYYYRARYYDAHIGRFVSEDPIGIDGGINLYVYVENNPVNYVDPLGLFFNEIIGWCGEWLTCNRAKPAYCESKYGDPCRTKCYIKFIENKEKLKACVNRCSLCQEDCLMSSCPYDCDIPEIK